MKTQSERIKLGREIVKIICDKMTTSHNIISKEDLPFLYADEIEKYKKQYGHLMAIYLEHQVKTDYMRQLILEIASKITPYFLSIAALVITEFGLGECHESATLAMYHLLKAKQENIAILMIQTNEHSITKKKYGHVFVLLGVTPDMLPKENNDISILNTLPNEVIVIDPFLNSVLPANQYLMTESVYLNLFEYNHISEITYYSSMSQEKLAQQDFLISKVKEKCVQARLEDYQIEEHNKHCNLFDIETLEPCEDTLMMKCLKQGAELRFQFGHKNYNLHAFAQINSAEDEEKAALMQQKLKAGYIYQQSQHSYFVLHHINHPGPLSDALWRNYGR